MILVAERVAAEIGRPTPIVEIHHLDAETPRRALDALIVPPNLTGHRPGPDDWAVAFIRSCAPKGTLLCSVCAGAFWLAAAGVLDGHRATTHWALDDELRDGHPRVTVDTSQIVLHDRNRITAGGVMAWTDLGLYLLQLWYGPAIATTVARHLVLDSRVRDQLMYRSFTPRTDHQNDVILRLQNKIARDCSAPMTVRDMAAFCALSERTFVRQFKHAVGMTPNVYLQRTRVEAARVLLETTRRPIGAIAFSVGYGDTAAFSKTFHTWMGVTPGDYRNRFTPRTRPGLDFPRPLP